MSVKDPSKTSPESASEGGGLPGGGLTNVEHFELLREVEVEITLEIGRRRMRIADILKLANGQILELSKAAGEPLDILVNGQLLGRGEAVVVGDRYGVRITELVSAASARNS